MIGVQKTDASHSAHKPVTNCTLLQLSLKQMITIPISSQQCKMNTNAFLFVCSQKSYSVFLKNADPVLICYTPQIIMQLNIQTASWIACSPWEAVVFRAPRGGLRVRSGARRGFQCFPHLWSSDLYQLLSCRRPHRQPRLCRESSPRLLCPPSFC